MTSDASDIKRRVLRRCAHCRLLFEAGEDVGTCVVCGAAVDGLALPLGGESAPSETVEREATSRMMVPRRDETS
jgi:ribosomal protein S27E